MLESKRPAALRAPTGRAFDMRDAADIAQNREELQGARLISFKPLVKGALRGFANVELPNGLRITDCPVLISNGKAWATLPSKPVLDRDGKHVEVSGKKQYAPILEWRDRDLSNRFSTAIVDLVRQHHPDALDESMAA